MKVYTYYKYIDCIQDQELIRVWERNWKEYGWETVILSEDDARNAQPERFERWLDHILLTTRNPAEYAKSALMRWLAMTVIEEPSIHIDIDVMCNGLKPEDVFIEGLDPRKPVFLAASTCPCAVAGNGEAWRMFVELMDNAEHLKRFNINDLLNDSCDQYATSITPSNFYQIHPEFLCKLYNEDPGWQTGKMIHFAGRVTPRPRSLGVKLHYGYAI